MMNKKLDLIKYCALIFVIVMIVINYIRGIFLDPFFETDFLKFFSTLLLMILPIIALYYFIKVIRKETEIESEGQKL